MAGSRAIQWKHPDGRAWSRALPPRKVGMLGAEVRLGHCLTLYCLACARTARLMPAQVAAIAARYGSDLPLQALLDRSVCRNCGGRWPWPDLHISPNVSSRGGSVVVVVAPAGE